MFNKDLSQFQRRSLQLFSSSIILTAFLTLMVRTGFKDYNPSGVIAWLVAVVPAIPFILVFAVIYSFLKNFVKISGPPAMAYVDIFLIASMITLRLHLRSSE